MSATIRAGSRAGVAGERNPRNRCGGRIARGARTKAAAGGSSGKRAVRFLNFKKIFSGGEDETRERNKVSTRPPGIFPVSSEAAAEAIRQVNASEYVHEDARVEWSEGAGYVSHAHTLTHKLSVNHKQTLAINHTHSDTHPNHTHTHTYTHTHADTHTHTPTPMHTKVPPREGSEEGEAEQL